MYQEGQGDRAKTFPWSYDRHPGIEFHPGGQQGTNDAIAARAAWKKHQKYSLPSQPSFRPLTHFDVVIGAVSIPSMLSTQLGFSVLCRYSGHGSRVPSSGPSALGTPRSPSAPKLVCGIDRLLLPARALHRVINNSPGKPGLHKAVSERCDPERPTNRLARGWSLPSDPGKTHQGSSGLAVWCAAGQPKHPGRSKRSDHPSPSNPLPGSRQCVRDENADVSQHSRCCWNFLIPTLKTFCHAPSTSEPHKPDTQSVSTTLTAPRHLADPHETLQPFLY
jgi:hypothetical protein